MVEHGLPEVRIDEVFSDFSREPKDPIPGASLQKQSDDDRKFQDGNFIINVPDEYKDIYQALNLDYHDVCSKSKFDIGRTDVIEHKVVLNTENPIHTRQFRIPFEHQETIKN